MISDFTASGCSSARLSDEVAAPGVPGDVGPFQADGLHEVVRVLGGGAKEVLVGGVGVVAVALADLVQGDDVEVPGEVVPVAVPVPRRVVHAVLAPMNEEEGFALTAFKVASLDSVHVNEFCVIHGDSSALGEGVRLMILQIGREWGGGYVPAPVLGGRYRKGVPLPSFPQAGCREPLVPAGGTGGVPLFLKTLEGGPGGTTASATVSLLPFPGTCGKARKRPGTRQGEKHAPSVPQAGCRRRSPRREVQGESPCTGKRRRVERAG